jgi:hypothetical protein
MSDERQQTVPWCPLIERAGPIVSLPYYQMWRVAHGFADIAERVGSKPVTMADIARELDMPHHAVQGAVLMLLELGLIERLGSGQIMVHLDRAPSCSIRDDFTPEELDFADRNPDVVNEIDRLIAIGKTTPAEALDAFRRFSEVADAVVDGTISPAEGDGIAIEITRSHSGNRWVN